LWLSCCVFFLCQRILAHFCQPVPNVFETLFHRKKLTCVFVKVWRRFDVFLVACGVKMWPEKSDPLFIWQRSNFSSGGLTTFSVQNRKQKTESRKQDE
jgi:hypothetical protein